jgi:TusA-related sulfurtransferase
MFNFSFSKSVRTIDCRDLKHPVPWQKVSKALRILRSNETIQILYSHTPSALIHLIGEMGLEYKITEKNTFFKKQIEILIWKNQ